MTLTSGDLKSITKRMWILKLVENDTSNVFLGIDRVYKLNKNTYFGSFWSNLTFTLTLTHDLDSDDIKSITKPMGILKLVENDTSNMFLCYLVSKLGPFEY